MTVRTLLAISYYRNPHLVDNIELVLDDVLASGQVHGVVLINDSPDDPELDSRLRGLTARSGVQYLRNEVNLGYTRSINQAYRLARAAGTHLICCNSDVRFTQETLEEVIAVTQLDDRIGFAFPRSNSDFQFGLTGALARLPHERRRVLPRFELTPTAVGYFLWVSNLVIDRFDGFDELFSPGYEEENDLILRAGQLGLRAALANHALIEHETSSSFSESADALKRKHHNLLLARHPYYGSLLSTYTGSERHATYQVLRQLRYVDDVVIDCFGFPGVLNGTTLYARDFLRGLNEINRQRQRIITVLVNESVQDLLGLDQFTHLRFCNSVDALRPHFALIRIGQPFHEETLVRALDKSACSVNVFFDTIAQDIASLRTGALEKMWRDLTLVYREVVFISDASRRAFATRYPRRDAGLHVVHPSLVVDEYGPGRPLPGGSADASAPVLVVGNKFPHKDIAHTMERLLAGQASGDMRFTVLTDSALTAHPRMVTRRSGALSQDAITALYAGCKLVLYPSYYEGFGLPLMEALHFRKPAIARHAPLYEELRERLGPVGQNLHLYRSFDELSRLLSQPPQWIEAPCTATLDWHAVASQVLDIADGCAKRFDFTQRCEAQAVIDSGQYRPNMSVAAEALAIRLHALNTRFPWAYRVLRRVYRMIAR